MYIKALLAPPEGHPSIKSSFSCIVLLPVDPPFSSTRSRLPRRSVAQGAATEPASYFRRWPGRLLQTLQAEPRMDGSG